MRTTTTRGPEGRFDVVQRGPAVVDLSPGELERLYWIEARRATLGLVRFSHDALRVLGAGPALLRFGPNDGDGRAILGGIFARGPHGVMRWFASDGEVVVELLGFVPRLRGPLWGFESWFHTLVGRRFLRRAAGKAT